MIVINNKIYLLILFFIFSSSPVFADTEYQVKCIPNSVVYNDILGCYIDEFKAVDKELNITYKKRINNLKKDKKDNLQNSQRNWIKVKESLCVADEANYGRESHFDAMQCEIDMTKKRIDFLKNFK